MVKFLYPVNQIRISFLRRICALVLLQHNTAFYIWIEILQFVASSKFQTVTLT